ncbi:Down syndrome cell adhesion molecule-like, partial [Tropilaelaps mercedesae]
TIYSAHQDLVLVDMAWRPLIEALLGCCPLSTSREHNIGIYDTDMPMWGLREGGQTRSQALAKYPILAGSRCLGGIQPESSMCPAKDVATFIGGIKRTPPRSRVYQCSGQMSSEAVLSKLSGGPHITSLAKSMHVRSSAETSLPCTVSGDEPLSIIWSKDGVLVPLHDERYIISEEKSFYGKKSILRLRAAERSDTATFSCTATNPYGKATEGMRLIVQGAPDPPDDIVFSDLRSTSVVAKWNIPYSGNSDISSYTINYHPASEPEAARVVKVPGTSADATLQELIPATQYQFVIKASNALGDSIFSKPALVKTKMDDSLTPSRGSSAGSESGQDPCRTDQERLALPSPYPPARPASHSLWICERFCISSPRSRLNSHQPPGALSPTLACRIGVTAPTHGFPSSPRGNSRLPSPSRGASRPPYRCKNATSPPVKLAPTGGQPLSRDRSLGQGSASTAVLILLSVHTMKPAERARNSHLSGYYVGYKETDAADQFIYKTVDIDHNTQPTSGREEYTVTGLKKNTKYTVVVQAFNPQGSGPSSNELVVKTYEYVVVVPLFGINFLLILTSVSFPAASISDPPPSPSLKIIATTSSSIHVRWEQDLSKYKVTGYLVHYKHAGAEWKEMQLHSFTTNKIIEGLLCGTNYQIFLTAFNDIGRGEPSPVIEVATEGRGRYGPTLCVVGSRSSRLCTHLSLIARGQGRLRESSRTSPAGRRGYAVIRCGTSDAVPSARAIKSIIII